MLGPVVSPTIDGSDYHTALLASTTPTLAWKPPSVGTAQYYAVYFGAKSTTAEGNPTIVNPMWFYTADTSITIPPGGSLFQSKNEPEGFGKAVWESSFLSWNSERV